jgi:hypothetical protein
LDFLLEIVDKKANEIVSDLETNLPKLWAILNSHAEP